MGKVWDVYVTRMLPEQVIDLLKMHCNVELNPYDRIIARGELLEKVKGKNAILPMVTEKIDAEVFDAAGSECRIVANYGVGYNNVDIGEATKRGIMVTNTPDVLTNATSEMAWALLFAVARKIVEGDKFTRAGKYKGWSPKLFVGTEITGKTLGIIGAGRIGSAFAKKSIGFEMKILYNAAHRNEAFERETGAIFADRETLLRESDFISLHVPLQESTVHLISTNEFKMMKNTAILINTARGPVVDENALIEALRTGEIAGAGLDVFEREPEFDPELSKLENVVIVPHIGSATSEARLNMGMIAAESIIAAMNGEIPKTLVNRDIKL